MYLADCRLKNNNNNYYNNKSPSLTIIQLSHTYFTNAKDVGQRPACMRPQGHR